MSEGAKGFWKGLLLVFLAARIPDAVQLLIGLWLVPKYVPVADIGAVLPMTQGAVTISLPLAIVMIPFSRWLTIYLTRGEHGRVRTLLRFGLPGSVALVLLMAVLTWLFVPGLIRSVGVSERGCAPVLFAAAVLAAVAPVFGNALQGLKRFGTAAVSGVSAAAVRFGATVLLMPLRTIIGYVGGMAAGHLVQVVVAGFGLKRASGSSVPAEPLEPGAFCRMFRYTVPLAFVTLTFTVAGMVQFLLIRRNLPEVESAAYFIVSRFGEIACWPGWTLTFLVFPLVAEAQERGENHVRLQVKALGLSVLLGWLVALAFVPFAVPMLSSVALWRDYAPYAWCIPLCAFRETFCATLGVFMGCEQARGDFRYLGYIIPCVILECVGIPFIHGIVPLLWWLTANSALEMLVVSVVLWGRR